eukprot:2546507-Amphidinium_carterae.2
MTRQEKLTTLRPVEYWQWETLTGGAIVVTLHVGTHRESFLNQASCPEQLAVVVPLCSLCHRKTMHVRLDSCGALAHKIATMADLT